MRRTVSYPTPHKTPTPVVGLSEEALRQVRGGGNRLQQSIAASAEDSPPRDGIWG